MDNNRTLIRGLKENYSIYPLEEDKRKFYDLLMDSGMFFEYFPKLSGNYEKDRQQWLEFWE